MVAPTTGPALPATTLSERFLELTTDIAAAVGFDGRIVGANPALTLLVGEPAAPRATDLMPDEDRAALSERWHELVTGARDTAEVEVRLGADERRWFLLSLVVDREAQLVYLTG